MGKPTVRQPAEICVQRPATPAPTEHPAAPPLIPSAVWECASTQQADARLGGDESGYVYQRDGHPNADWLSQQIAQLHGTEFGQVTASGMAALSAVLLAHCSAGDRLAISNQLYGRTSKVFGSEAQRLGMRVIEFDPLDTAATQQVLAEPTRLVVVETISNPRLRVPDLEFLAAATHRAGGRLLVDNTFATPLVCQPLRWGADWVVESVSKLMNGHGDLMLGAVCGVAEAWERVPEVIASWGFASSPFDCWLAQRGLATLELRIARACDNAARIAAALEEHPRLVGIDYPGLRQHPDHLRAQHLFASPFSEEQPPYGHVVTLHLRGGRPEVDRLIKNCPEIPFFPSLGDLRTSLSHPESTSHRGLTAETRRELGIQAGTVRLSAGLESPSWLVNVLRNALDSLDHKPECR